MNYRTGVKEKEAYRPANQKYQRYNIKNVFPHNFLIFNCFRNNCAIHFNQILKHIPPSKFHRHIFL